MGGRKIYSLDLPLVAVAATLPRPDPEHPTQGNRRVDRKHAHDFADYIREKEEWVSPAEIGGSQYGVLSIPRVSRGELGILDGQHRILGIHMAIEEVTEDLRRARDLAATAKRNGEDPAVIRTHEARVKKLGQQL